MITLYNARLQAGTLQLRQVEVQFVLDNVTSFRVLCVKSIRICECIYNDTFACLY